MGQTGILSDNPIHLYRGALRAAGWRAAAFIYRLSSFTLQELWRAASSLIFTSFLLLGGGLKIFQSLTRVTRSQAVTNMKDSMAPLLLCCRKVIILAVKWDSLTGATEIRSLIINEPCELIGKANTVLLHNMCSGVRICSIWSRKKETGH